jgi:chemotaxis protein methyltransferase CheR
MNPAESNHPRNSDRMIPSIGYGDYLRFSRLVQEYAGLHFPEKRRADLEQGVREAFAASTATDLNAYYHLLLEPDHGIVHMQRLVNALTIGESHFFRDKGQFDALYKHVLPQIIQRRRSLRTLRIWSAGCAAGEEPYSIAILLRELLPDVDDWAITILGTDINTEALSRARKGVYSEWAFREERAKRLRLRYFNQSASGRYQLIPEVRRMVTFTQLNLMEDAYPSYQTNTTFMDMIFCRNVTIYFAPSTTRQVVERFYDCLVDEGWLIVGHSEHSLITYSQFQACSYPNTILYQRTARPAVLPEDWDWLPPTPLAEGAPSLRVPPPASGDAGDEFVLGDFGNATSFGAPTGTPTGASSILTEGQPTDVSTPQDVSDASEEGDPLVLAEECLDYGHSEQARDLLLTFIKEYPESVKYGQAAALLGHAYANLAQWEEAEHWCREAIGLDNLALGPYYTLALVLQHQGMLDEAIDTMRKVVYIDRTFVLGHFGLADLYHSKGRLPQALKSLDNARRLLSLLSDSEVVRDSGGITVGSLKEAIIRQQQQWSAEAAEMS